MTTSSSSPAVLAVLV